MLITFLSPALGWDALATHHELEHAHDNVDAAHSHDSSTQDHHDDSEAHGVIGHLLGHLPVCFSALPAVPTSAAASSVCPYLAADFPRVSLEPPLKPPRFS
jgi:hypothetical protein